MKLEVYRNGDFYAILDKDVESPEGKLVMNGNLWDYAYAQIEERGISEEEFILELQGGAIAEYVATGITIWDRHNLGNGHNVSVPTRNIRAGDKELYEAARAVVDHEGGSMGRLKKAVRTLS